MRNDRETRLEEARERSLKYSSSEILVLTIRFRSSEYLSFEIMLLLLLFTFASPIGRRFPLFIFAYRKIISGWVHKGQENCPSLNHESIIQGDGAGIPTGCHRIIAIIATASL
jgi:hypothetical protein